ncbi:MAG TPA: helix-hairpin-helix domain-containing protein [Capsulimonadaceae bacterium]|nr:helix-hairpin-helix domain-containing protein [Capsulimonadaceae bacterium]
MNYRKRQTGYVLIQALVVIAGLVALMAMLYSNQHAALDVLQNRLDQRRAHQAAEAAMAEALATLQQANTNQVALTDNWAQLGSNGGVQSSSSNTTTADQEYTMGDGSSFRVQLVDAGSLININSATQQQLQQLPLTQEQVDSLLDFVSAGETARPDGAKDAFYNALPQPYNAALGPLTTVNELLLVNNWTAQTLYQPITNVSGSLPMPTDSQGNTLPLAALFTVDSGSPNTQPSGSALINFNQRRLNVGQLTRAGLSPAIARRIASRAPYANFAALLRQPGIDSQSMQILLNMACFSTATRQTGKVNLNTASQAVLQTIPNVSTTMASDIVAQQGQGFTSLGQLATLPGISQGQIPQIADSFTTGSDTWIVRAWGEDSGVGEAVEAVVRVTNSQAQVINWDHISATTIPTWWDWPAQTSNTIQAGVIQQ